jgi:enoyl-CoA hydratase/carnithine racemase
VNHDAFIETLLSETADALKRVADTQDSIRAVVFLYLNRAYEAGLDPDTICDLLGASEGCVLQRAGLSKQNEAAVMDAYSVLDPMLAQQYSESRRS